MGNMADKPKETEESKTEEIKEKFSEVKETLKGKFEDCKEKAFEGVDAVKEKASEVVKTVKGETEKEEETDSKMMIAFALLGAWGSGYLAHKAGNDAVLCLSTSSGAVLLGGKNFSGINFFSRSSNFPGVSLILAWGGVNNPSKKKK